MELLFKRHIYTINYKSKEKDLCELEMKSLFNEPLINKFVFSDTLIDPNDSVFFKNRLDVMFMSKSIDELSRIIEESNLTLDGYKITYIKNDVIEYEKRLEAMKKIGNSIEGNFDLKTPKHNLCITRIDNIWYFGKYTKNNSQWVQRKTKPYNYSIALDISLAKSLVNIASKNRKDIKIIDPCCGIGTVVIEGLVMGLDIVGYEINSLIARHANENLRHFGFDEVIKNKDMTIVKESYDVAIIDLPYGMYTPTTKNLQTDIIIKSRDITAEAVIVSKEQIDTIITESGYKITDKVELAKTRTFSRFIYVCK